MKRLLLLCLLPLLCFQLVKAQERSVSGMITDAGDGTPIPGVSVIIKGTTTGTITDTDGSYTLNVPSDEAILIYSYMGMTTQEIVVDTRSVIDVKLSADVTQLSEVVVTALGIEREQKALGYAVQKFDGEDFVKVKNPNIVSALSGRVAGVQISGNSHLGGSSRILIRGANSFTGQNQPLFIVDGIPIDNANFSTYRQERAAGGVDYGNAAQDINSEDIENISVLKGAAAAALYGSRGANGVILITTKKGGRSNKKGIGVDMNSGFMINKHFLLPHYQDKYGAPLLRNPDGSLKLDAEGNPIIDHSLDGSWGAPLDGTVITRHWDSYDESDPENFGETRPMLSHPNNINDFLETGHTINNSIAISGGGNTTNFRVSYTNLNQKSIYPNSYLRRNTVGFSGSISPLKKLTAKASGSYVYTKGKGRVASGNGNGNPIYMFNQWYQRQLDTERLKNYKNPNGTQRTWNRRSPGDPRPQYFNNPYWERYENVRNDSRERFFGGLTVMYQFTDFLNVYVKGMIDFYVERREEQVAVGSVEIPYYFEEIYDVGETNYETMLTFDKQYPNFSVNAFLGANHRRNGYYRNRMATRGGLNTPNFYNVLNSAGVINAVDYKEQKVINSIFANASLGYKGMLYLDITGRNDWSSTLSVKNNSYFYPSIGGSFVFSELTNINFLSFGKIRASWGLVSNDTEPYEIYLSYISIVNFRDNPITTVPNTLNNVDLKPESTSSWEVGTQLEFFQSRVGLDFTYYHSKTTDLIYDVDASASTGYRSRVINAGIMSNKGFEVVFNAIPVKTAGFKWNIGLNWSKNKNEVVELAEGVETIQLGNLYSVYVEARKGKTYGAIVGSVLAKDENGNNIIDSQGRYAQAPEIGVVGSVLPDWNGGITNTFSYKGLTVNTLFDVQSGGTLFSLTISRGRYSGMLEETADPGLREHGLILDGVVQTGTNENGYPVSDGTPNTTIISASRWGADQHTRGRAEQNSFDASYVKFREASIGYRLPLKWISKTPFQEITLSVVGRNLAILYKKIPHIDPEAAVSASNIQGFESGQLPPERSIGFNLRLKF